MHDPVLYILMRTDLDSLNPGKAMAQACHAANQMVWTIENEGNSVSKESLKRWQSQAGTFGTTIVLDAGSENSIRNKVDFIQRNVSIDNAISEITIDPEYPIRDGKVIHIIGDFLTCAWVFSPNGRLSELDDMKLHP
jgi:peptidyl-tRNA hydrolase